MAVLKIEDLVQRAKDDFKKWAKGVALAEIAVAAPELLNPWVRWIIEPIIDLVIAAIVNRGEKGLFNINADYLTSDLAKDYRAAIADEMQAPETISDEEWEKLIEKSNAAFDRMYRLDSGVP